MFAPSQYINVPLLRARLLISRIFSSKSPRVLGFVSITSPTSGVSDCLNLSISMLPRESEGMVMVSHLHIAALAGFVPCAESGISIFVLFSLFCLK